MLGLNFEGMARATSQDSQVGQGRIEKCRESNKNWMWLPKFLIDVCTLRLDPTITLRAAQSRRVVYELHGEAKEDNLGRHCMPWFSGLLRSLDGNFRRQVR